MSFQNLEQSQGNVNNVFNLPDYEYELDSDITLATGESHSDNFKFNQAAMTSPIKSRQTYRYNKPTRYANSSPRITRNSSQHTSIVDLDGVESYDEDEDDDYYPTISDGELTEEEEDEDGTIDQSGMIQRIKPDVTAMEKVVILSTFIGTALGIVIGYILFLSENE